MPLGDLGVAAAAVVALAAIAFYSRGVSPPAASPYRLTSDGRRIFEPDELAAAADAGAKPSAAAVAAAALADLPPTQQGSTPPQQSSAPPQQLLLVIVGEVYDVTEGHSFYSAGGGYEGFCNGTDNSRAFLTADFDLNATDNLDGLKPGECLGIHGWSKFYANHSKYQFVGLLHGRFYDADGAPTDALRRYEECVGRGLAARGAARVAVDAAPMCGQATPPRSATGGDTKYDIGKWMTFWCTPPLVPRRVFFVDAANAAATGDARAKTDTCACLPVAGDPSWDPIELGMEDDQELPQPYNRRECVKMSTCTVKLS